MNKSPRRNPLTCVSRHIRQFRVLTTFFSVGVGSHNLKIRLIESLADMKFLARSHTRLQRPASLLKWHRWFAWYPVVVRFENGLKHWVWLEHLERKWSLGRYGDRKGHWRYRHPMVRALRANLHTEQYDVARDGPGRVPPDLRGREARRGESRLQGRGSPRPSGSDGKPCAVDGG
jgi:hypothetical protein